MNTRDLEHRFNYHPADTEEKKNLHSSVRAHCLGLSKYLNEILPEGRELSLAITHLEEVMMWSNAALARGDSHGRYGVQ